jgi:hypothetical protein
MPVGHDEGGAAKDSPLSDFFAGPESFAASGTS